jgi:hypothetical protein
VKEIGWLGNLKSSVFRIFVCEKAPRFDSFFVHVVFSEKMSIDWSEKTSDFVSYHSKVLQHQERYIYCMQVLEIQ